MEPMSLPKIAHLALLGFRSHPALPGPTVVLVPPLLPAVVPPVDAAEEVVGPLPPRNLAIATGASARIRTRANPAASHFGMTASPLGSAFCLGGFSLARL